MDAACVELKFASGSMIAIDTIAVENEVAEYSCAVKPHVRSDGNRQSGTRKPLSASLLA